MDSSQLTPEQAQRIVDAVGPALGYCCRLAHRMQRIGWKPSDPMYVAAWAAYDALHSLHIAAHYATCRGTGGRPSEPMPPGATPSPAAPPFTTHPGIEPRKDDRPWVGKRKRKGGGSDEKGRR